MPIKLNIQQQFFVSDSPLEFIPLLSLLALVSLIGLAWRSSSFYYALLFFGITLAPTIVLPLHILVNDHRLYLAMFAPALALASSYDRIRQRPQPLPAVDRM